MFKYEDMDYQSLSTSLDIENPDGPDELYALAQFCRMGKGIQPSEENYRLYLKRAADAGSQKAIQELNTLSVAVSASKTQPAEKAVASMTLPEMLQAADNGNPYVLLPLAEKALTKELLDLPKAKAWLEKAAALAPQGVYSDADATKIYLMLARLLTNMSFDTPENRELSHRYFGLAAELGSQEACDALADQYESGYGCKPDADKVKFYRSRGVLNNDPAYLCRQCCKLLVDGGSRMDMLVTLNRIHSMTQDADVLTCVDLLTAAAGQTVVTPALVEWGWEHLENNSESSVTVDGRILAMAYGNDPQTAVAKGLPVDGDKTGYLAKWMPNEMSCFLWAKYGAEQGCSFAQALLAECYRSGRGTAIDVDQCIAWGKKAVDNNSGYACVVLGRLYLSNDSVRNYDDALYWLQTASMAGIADADYLLGYMYENGLGVPQDYEKAVSYYKSAADQNSEDAQYQLAYLYDMGCGVPQDYAKALELYQKAAAQGHKDALNNLGCMYDHGTGVPQDEAKAAELYKAAAEKGNLYAMRNLAALYSNGQGVPQDEAKAAELVQKAAALGDIESIGILGLLYAKGDGVEQDYGKAASLLQKATEQGNAKAMNNLAKLYANGWGVPQDDKKAIQLFHEAADKGIVDASITLAKLYESGTGVPQDDAKAEAYYRAAADAGDEEAKKWLSNHKTGKLFAWVRKYMPIKSKAVAYGGEIGLLLWPSVIFVIIANAFYGVQVIMNVCAILAAASVFASAILALKIVVMDNINMHDPHLPFGVILTPVMLIRAAIGAFQKKK